MGDVGAAFPIPIPSTRRFGLGTRARIESHPQPPGAVARVYMRSLGSVRCLGTRERTDGNWYGSVLLSLLHLVLLLLLSF